MSEPADGWNEELYQATAAVLAAPEEVSSPWRGAGCLILSVGLFVLASWADSSSFDSVFILVGVLFFHEMGHFVGMRLFGYRNLRMFFIPFFGAAVTGRKHAAPAWQRGIVLLLGPLPGLYLGLVLQLVAHPAQDETTGRIVLMLAALNAFNLLPIVPLDGGRLVDLLFFAGRPLLAAIFTGFAALALASLAIFGGSWCIGLLAVLIAVIVPARYRQGKIERTLGNNRPEWPGEFEQLSESQRRDLFGWAILLNPLDKQPNSLAGSMRNLHETVVTRRPGVGSWLLLFALYLSGYAVAVGTAVLSRAHTSAAETAKADLLATESLSDFGEIRRLRQANAGDEELERARQALHARFQKQSRSIQVMAFGQLLRQPDRDPSDAAELLALDKAFQLVLPVKDGQ